MPSLIESVTHFFQAIAGVIFSLVNSIIAVFASVLALFQDIANSGLKLVTSLVGLILDLFQGVLGFVMANILIIGVAGVGYYIYTTTQKGRGSRKV